MEALLDGVEEGNVKWKTVVKNFYPDLQEAVEKAEKELEEVELADELADTLWVLLAIANQHGIDMAGAFANNVEKKNVRDCKRHKQNKKITS